jgi:hypothetical protein
LAVAEALLRGYQASIVGRHSLIEVNGRRAQVQVAAKGAWQIADIDKFTSATIERVVLVDIADGSHAFYVCPGDRLRSDVRKRHDQYLASRGGTRARNPDSKYALIFPEQVRKWRNGWSRLV